MQSMFARTNPPPLRDPDFVLPAKVHDPRPAVSHWAIQQDRSKVNLGVSARGLCITSSRLSARTWGLLALCHSLKTSTWPGFRLRALSGNDPESHSLQTMSSPYIQRCNRGRRVKRADLMH